MTGVHGSGGDGADLVLAVRELSMLVAKLNKTVSDNGTAVLGSLRRIEAIMSSVHVEVVDRDGVEVPS